MLADGIADPLAAHHRLAMLPGLLVHADTVGTGGAGEAASQR